MGAEIALVNMPFFSVTRPSLGLSLLKADLDQVGYCSDVHYLNLSFASFIGYELYDQLENQAEGRLAVEWIFAEALWGHNQDLDREFLDYLRGKLAGELAERFTRGY